MSRYAAIVIVLVLNVPAMVHAQAPARVPKPAAVRGLYLNSYAAGSPSKLAKLVEIADSTEINTFVIDVKEGGYISYRSTVPLAKQIGARLNHIKDMKNVLATLKAHGIYPIARIVAFKDPVLANARPAYAIKTPKGEVFHADDGSAWVDPYNKDVWDYNIALAREAIGLGFSEVQWDYVRFPDVPWKLGRQMRFPARAGRSKQDAIREFVIYSKKQLADLHVPVTADVFGATVSVGDDMGIGQKWALLVDVADVLLPMVYPSHYSRGSYGIAHPNAEPYEIVRTAMKWARHRTDDVPHGAAIRPWLQDFTLGLPRYGAEQVRAQMQAVYDSGLTEWVLWNPASNYTLAALEHRTEEPPPILPDTAKPPLLGVPADSAKPNLGPGSNGRPLDALPAPVRIPRDTTMHTLSL
jgi:hypothetical protein